MGRKIKISIGDRELAAQLNDTRIAGLIWNALPISASASTWGEEIYFSIPVVEKKLADPKEVVELGDLGYWPGGHAFCIFFGQTPVSTEGEIRPASSVEVVGKILGGIEELKKVPSGESIILERAE